jgi:hypothetical protein
MILDRENVVQRPMLIILVLAGARCGRINEDRGSCLDGISAHIFNDLGPVAQLDRAVDF